MSKTACQLNTQQNNVYNEFSCVSADVISKGNEIRTTCCYRPPRALRTHTFFVVKIISTLPPYIHTHILTHSPFHLRHFNNFLNLFETWNYIPLCISNYVNGFEQSISSLVQPLRLDVSFEKVRVVSTSQ